MSPPPVVFRCHADAQVGLGHLMRGVELARRLVARGHACGMIGPVQSLISAGERALFTRWQEVPERGTSLQDAARVIAMAADLGARHAVIDDYRADPPFQAALQGAGLRWLQQFDASRPFDFLAPVLVNAGPSERRADYAPYLKNPNTETLFGPAYAVLRPAFTAVAPGPDGRPLQRLLVAFGGGDDRGAVALTQAACPAGVTPVVVIGRGHPDGGALAARAAAAGAEVHRDPPDLPALMASCDAAVIAGGTMSYEAAILGLPMVILPLAPNQIRAARGWAALAGARVSEAGPATLPAHLRQMLADLARDDAARTAMARAGRAAVDGQGAERLLERLLAEPRGVKA